MNNTSDLSPFDHERIDAIKGMLVDQVAHAKSNGRGTHRVALLVSLIVAALLVSTGGAAWALSGGLPFVPPPAPPAATAPAPSLTPTPTPTPTPTLVPIPSPTGTATLNGFDLDSVYRACDAVVPAGVWGDAGVLAPEPRRSDSFGVASAEPYAAEHTNGDANAIYVYVTYMVDQTMGFSALCVASGDPAEPTVTYIRTLD